MRKTICPWLLWLVVGWLTASVPAGVVRSGTGTEGSRKTCWLENDQLRCSIFFDGDRLAGERLDGLPAGTGAPAVETDAGFALELVWTDWQAPGKINNADNPVRFTSENFSLARRETIAMPSGGCGWDLFLQGDGNPLRIRLSYRLEPGDFFIRRQVAVFDPEDRHHFLQQIWTYDARVRGRPEVVKAGGFGQPVALRTVAGGAFFGLEYPAADNSAEADHSGRLRLRCGQEIGEQTGPDGVESDWTVAARTPDDRVQYWFFQYLARVRVAPPRPYLLYNSWYDLRSPELAETPGAVMNETNILRIIDLFRRNMLGRHGLNLDAFVLDDGWDVYRSDWQRRDTEFPRGLAPIAAKLGETGTALGLWFGPTGGYSKRDWRVGWMKEHGYETVGDQLCLAGRNYRQLFGKRVNEFIEREGVGYFKWDGIQFACSEPGHGHPVGIHSRRAVLQAVESLCREARQRKPGLFLNITSGTWLSPWWLRFADQIWMGGEDYEYADVPSLSRRDAAITYRDTVLHEDFRVNDFWFPLANLMTHGIIKGRLERLGDEKESLDKFTDDVMFYFSRGISMFELYVSPDLLNDGEWRAISQSARWARDRFPILSNTRMIGGNPRQGEPYGYVHFQADHGIIAARNPFIAPARLRVSLSPELGLDPAAASLVVERVYPTRWISPQLYSAGGTVELDLAGYESAVYEIYPLPQARYPLVAGAVFELARAGDSRFDVTVFPDRTPIRILNPETIRSIRQAGRSVVLADLAVPLPPPPRPTAPAALQLSAGGSTLDFELTADDRAGEATVAVLLRPAEGFADRPLPAIAAFLDGAMVPAPGASRPGRWSWSDFPVAAGPHKIRWQLLAVTDPAGWRGRAEVWLLGNRPHAGIPLSFITRPSEAEPPMPPRAFAPGRWPVNDKLGELEVQALAGPDRKEP